jgi:hypothetical protein
MTGNKTKLVFSVQELTEKMAQAKEGDVFLLSDRPVKGKLIKVIELRE